MIFSAAIPTIDHQFTAVAPWDTNNNSNTSSTPSEAWTKEQLLARIREIESTNKKQVKENENLKAALEKANSRCQKEELKNARLKASTAARLIKVKRFQSANMTKAKARAIVHEALSPYLHKDQVDWFLSKEKVNKKAK